MEQEIQFASRLDEAKYYIKRKRDKAGFFIAKVNDFVGKGLFTARSFRKGDFLIEYQGELISKKEGEKRASVYPLHLGSFIFFFRSEGSDMCIDATHSYRKGRFANDAVGKLQNAEMRIVYNNSIPHLCLFAKKDIEEGMEIRYDYGVSTLYWRKKENNFLCKTVSSSTPSISTGRSSRKKINIPLQNPDFPCKTASSTKERIPKSTRSRERINLPKQKDCFPCIMVSPYKQCISTKRKKKVNLQQQRIEFPYKKVSSSKQKRYISTCAKCKKKVNRPSQTQKEITSKEKEVELCKDPFSTLHTLGNESRSMQLKHCEVKLYKLKIVEQALLNGEVSHSHDEVVVDNADGLGDQSTIDRYEVQQPHVSGDAVNSVELADDNVVKTTADNETKETEQAVLNIEMPQSHDVVVVDNANGMRDENAVYLASVNTTRNIVKERTSGREVEQLPVSEVEPGADSIAKTTADDETKGKEQDLFNGKEVQQAHEVVVVDNAGGLGDESTVKSSTDNTTQSIGHNILNEVEESQSPDAVVAAYSVEFGQEGVEASTSDNTSNSKASPVLNINEVPHEANNEINSVELGEKNNSSKNQVQRKGKKKRKPHRPCPFCKKFKSKLSLHMKTVHKNEEMVKYAMSLPKVRQQKIFDSLRKDGILLKNKEIMSDTSIENKNTKLLRERIHNKSGVVMCSLCKGFYSARGISRHKGVCWEEHESKTRPVSINVSLVNTEPSTNLSEKFNEMILSRFRNDDIGDICREEKVIKILGEGRFQKVLARRSKQHSLREKLMGDMRQLANLYKHFKEKAKENGVNITSCEEMFDHSYINLVQEALVQITLKEDGSMKSGLCYNLGYLLKKACRDLKAYFIWKSEPERAVKFDQFLSVLNLLWDNWFSEAQYNLEKARQSYLRKPKNLPADEDVEKLRKYNVDAIQNIVSEEYKFISSEDFVRLRDLLACRLTLYNARRGGEACRLLLKEWQDAESGEWIGKNSENITDPSEIKMLKNVKIAYQAGKNLKQMVPVLIPKDCLAGIRKIADPIVRSQSSVHKKNPFLFANTKNSDTHVKGWNCVKAVSEQAGLSSKITATKMRHRVSTLYAAMDVPENERQAFYQHMGHSSEINKHVYQAPLAIQEVTKVGKFLNSLDCTFSDQVNEEVNTENENADANTDMTSDYGPGTPYRLEENIDEGESPPSSSAAIENSLEHVFKEQSPNSNNNSHDLTANEDSDCDIDYQPETESDSDKSSDIEENEEVQRELKDILKSEIQLQRRRKRKPRAYWTLDDEEIVMHHFRTTIVDFSSQGRKGSLPSRKLLRQFVRGQNESFLQGLCEEEKVRKLHTKLFNERAKRRKIMDEEQSIITV